MVRSIAVVAVMPLIPDPALLAKIRSALGDFGLKYIPYDYAASKTYNGRCRALLGFSWANRYFSHIVDLNSEEKPFG